MRRVVVWILRIAGIAVLLAAFSISGQGGGVEVPGNAGPVVVKPMVYRVGFPDAWATWEKGPNGSSFDVELVRWSFGVLAVSVFALCYAVRLDRHAPSQPPDEPPLLG